MSRRKVVLEREGQDHHLASALTGEGAGGVERALIEGVRGIEGEV